MARHGQPQLRRLVEDRFVDVALEPRVHLDEIGALLLAKPDGLPPFPRSRRDRRARQDGRVAVDEEARGHDPRPGTRAGCDFVARLPGKRDVPVHVADANDAMRYEGGQHRLDPIRGVERVDVTVPQARDQKLAAAVHEIGAFRQRVARIGPDRVDPRA